MAAASGDQADGPRVAGETRALVTAEGDDSLPNSGLCCGRVAGHPCVPLSELGRHNAGPSSYPTNYLKNKITTKKNPTIKPLNYFTYIHVLVYHSDFLVLSHC